MPNKILSFTNEYRGFKKYKVIYFLGIKIAFCTKSNNNDRNNSKNFNFHKESSNIPKIGTNVVIDYETLFAGNGNIELHDFVQLGWNYSPYYYNSYGFIDARKKNSKIEIGENTIINNNFVIGTNDKTVVIGKNCRIGLNFLCVNNDGHGLKIQDRDNPDAIISKDIKIGDNCFIGNNVTILKGVNIGAGCVIGSGAVVTKSFEDNSIIAGNPAKLIRKIDEKQK